MNLTRKTSLSIAGVAMIALAGALRLQAGGSSKLAGAFAVRPRWPLSCT